MTTTATANDTQTHSHEEIVKPNIMTWQTANGAKVLFIQSHEVPIVDIQISFNAGSAYDSKHYGLASLTSSLLETGTKNLSEDEIINQITQAGAHFNEHVSRDAATFTLRSMSVSEYLKPAIELFSQILTTPTFPKAQFDRVKKQQITAITMDDQYPDEVAYKALMKALYPNHPYGHPVDGTIESVQAITQENVIHFYQKYYVGKNATIAMIGDIDEKEAKALSEAIVKGLPSGEKAASIPTPQPLTKSETIHIPFPSNQTTIIEGTLGIEKGNSQFFALLTANQILGGDGMTSLLFQKVRKDNGLAYGVSSAFRTMKVNGIFMIEAKTRNNKANESLDIINQTLADFITNGPSEAELTMAKRYLIGSFPLSIATNRSKLNLLSTIGFYNLPLNYLDSYIEQIQNLTQTDLKNTFGQIINPKAMVTVTVGEKEK